jgi:glucose/mannose transport system permease protein
MAEATLTAETSRPNRIFYNIFIRNLSAKIAAMPMIATVLVVFVGCSIWTVAYSLTNSGALPNGSFVGLDQYERLFHTSRFMRGVRNLALYGVLSLSFTLVMGFLLAVLMDQKIRFENTFRTIMLYPFALSIIVTGLVWQWIMNPTFGIQQVVRGWGFTSFTFDWLANGNMVIYALVIAGLWQGTGLVMILMLAGLRGVDDEIWKAARVDGIPAWKTYLFIVLPMMRGVVVTTLVLVGSGIVRLYDLVVALTQGGPGFASDVPAKYVYDYMFARSNLGQGLAASTVMLLTVLIILIPWAYMEFGPKKNQ